MISKRSFLLIVLLFGLSLVARANDSVPSSPQPPIEGIVVSISQVGDLFLFLDTNGDGTGDVWVKIDTDTQLLDEAGEVIPPSSVTVGMLLILTRYEFEGSYYEVSQAIVSQGKPKGSVGLSGEILLAFPFGSIYVFALDFDRDGKADTVVKIPYNALITNMQGALLDPNTLQVGRLLSLVSHTLDSAGNIIAWHAIVGDGEISASTFPTLVGIVRQQQELAGIRYVLLENPDLAVAQNYLDRGRLIPIQLDRRTLVQDSNGQTLPLDSIQIGARLEVSDYVFIEGYFKAKRVIPMR